MLFFVADDGTHGKELWRSNGAESGTVMIKDIHPGGRRPRDGIAGYAMAHARSESQVVSASGNQEWIVSQYLGVCISRLSVDRAGQQCDRLMYFTQTESVTSLPLFVCKQTMALIYRCLRSDIC
jgi:ELWxxDGT repeat protein